MKRVATPALVAGLTAAAHPAAAQVPKLPPALAEAHASHRFCSPPLPELVHGEDIRSYPLGDGQVLYMIPCAAGAYNFSHALYIWRPEADFAERILFAEFSERYGWTGTDYLFGAEFEPGTGILSSFYKGRGLADCGTAGVWVWEDYGFRLEAFFAQWECDMSIEPGDFPQVWPLVE